MIDDPLSYISKEIQNCLCLNSAADPTGVIKLIDKHISFPINPEIWRSYFKSEPEPILENLLTSDEQLKLIEQLKRTIFPIDSVKVDNGRCFLSFNRLEVIKFLFHEILESTTYGRNIKVNQKRIEVIDCEECDTENLINCRTKLVQNCLQNVLAILDFQQSPVDSLSVSSVSSRTDINTVKCGLVVEPKTKKVCELKTSEYLEMRSTDMRLIAMHKYGMRIKDDIKFKDMIRKLGLAAVAVDLLEVKHTSPVQINRKGQGSTKGKFTICFLN